MALAQTSLGSITTVEAGQTTAVYTVGSAQTTYVRSLVIYNQSNISVQNAQIHVVPNSGGSAGTAVTGTRIARLGIGTDDTYFFECAYPITLTANGDTIQVQNEGTGAAINVLVLGDREG
jgi:hypothetical protein